MAVNMSELIRQAPAVLDFTVLAEMDENKDKIYSTIINMLSSHITKTPALKKLLDLLKPGPPEMSEFGSKLFVSLNRIVAKQSEPTNIRVLAAKCLACVVKVAADGGDLQREVSASVPSLVNSILHSGCPDVWVPLLTQIMKTFPGPCGPIRTQIVAALSGLVGRGVVGRDELGAMFTLYPQLGGGGREGIEHSRNFVMMWETVTNTVNQLINQFFKFIQRGEQGAPLRDVLSLEPVAGSGVTAYLNKLSQLLDLVEIQCSMLTLPFPQSREVRCEGIIDQVMRILEVSEASLKQIDIPEVEVLRLLLPSLHVQALQLLQALVISVEEDILPEVATINNIFIKTFQASKSSRVREALYDTLAVYQQTLGAMSGLEYCFGRFMPYLAEDVTPKQEKILLAQRQKRGGGGNRKRKHGQPHQFKSVVKVPQNLAVTRAALRFIGRIVSSVGCLLSVENYRDISCILVNLSLRDLVTDNESLKILYENLGLLALNWNPQFTSPLRLSLHVLQAATLHPNPGVSDTAKRVVAQLVPLLHSSSPSLYVPVVQENEMRRLVSKLLVEDEDDDDKEEEMNQDQTMDQSTPAVEASRVQSEATLKFPSTLTAPRTTATTAGASKSEVKEQPKPQYQPKKTVTQQAVKRKTGEKVTEKEKEKTDELLENVESLQSNIQEIQANEETKRRKQEPQSAPKAKVGAPEEPQLDVSEMLKDFSDKLNENLLPDPWAEDSE